MTSPTPMPSWFRGLMLGTPPAVLTAVSLVPEQRDPITLPTPLPRGAYHEHYYQPDGSTVRMVCISSLGVRLGEFFCRTITQMQDAEEELERLLDAVDPRRLPARGLHGGLMRSDQVRDPHPTQHTVANQQPIELPMTLERGVYHEQYYEPDGLSVRMVCISSRAVRLGERVCSTIAEMHDADEELTRILDAADPLIHPRPQLCRSEPSL